jgi:hypothetical protein
MPFMAVYHNAIKNIDHILKIVVGLVTKLVVVSVVQVDGKTEVIV